MKTCSSPRPLPLLALLLGLSTTAAHADNADLDVPGPTGRTWVALSGSRSAGYGESEDATTGEKLIESNSTRRGMALDVSLALHERVSVNLWAERSLYRSKQKYTPSNYSYTYSSATNSAGVGVDLRPIGTPTSDGFGLVTSAWLDHSEGGDNFYSLTVQPQYRFNGSWLGAWSLHLGRGSDNFRAYALGGRAVWKITPNMSLSPGVIWSRSETAGYPASRGVGADVTYTYHFDRNLSFAAGLGVNHAADQQYGSVRSVNNYGGSFTAGVRWAF